MNRDPGDGATSLPDLLAGAQGDAEGATIEVVYADARRIESLILAWRPGLTVQDALEAAAGLLATIPRVEHCGLGVFGERVGPAYLLLPGDRLEILPPLPQDPKVTRRQRAMDAKARSRASAGSPR